MVPNLGHEHQQTRDTELLKKLLHKFPSSTRVRQRMVPSSLRGGPVVPPAWHCQKWRKSRRPVVPPAWHCLKWQKSRRPIVPPAWYCLKWQKSRRLGVPSSRQKWIWGSISTPAGASAAPVYCSCVRNGRNIKMMIFKHLQTGFSLYESNVRQGVQAVTSSHASSSAADWSGAGPNARNDIPGSYTLKYVSLIIIYSK